jgi:hypothetical protein
MKKQEMIKALINDGGSAKFAQMFAVVEQKQLKTGNPLKSAKITKLVEYNMLLNANYQNMVNNRRVAEGKEADFVSKETWFVKVNDGFNGSIVANRKDAAALYLFFACNAARTHTYFVDGVEATAEEIEIIKQFKPAAAKATNQGLDRDVIVRTVKFEGIRKIVCGTTLNFAE